MMRKLIVLLLLGTAGCVQAPVSESPPAVGPSPAERLQALIDADWERRLRRSPLWLASLNGDRRYNDRWADLRPEALAADRAERRQLLAGLEAIDPAALDEAARLNHRLLRDELRTSIERDAFGMDRIPLNHLSGVQNLSEVVERLRFSTEQDYRDWLARLQSLGTYIDQHIALMREGIATGVVPPRVVMERVPPQIAAQIVERPEDSGFYAPFRALPATLPATLRSELRDAARKAIAETVVPAYGRLLRFVNEEYLPACRESIGASAFPDGEAFYAFEVRRHTTSDFSADQIHRIGLAEVARIRAAMDAIIRELGFDGDFKAFLRFLRTDSRFYYERPEDLLAGYREIAKRIDPELVKLFGKLPRLPYGVMAMPAQIAPDAPTAYYLAGAADGSRAGYFAANLYKPETRPKYEMEVLTVHEAVPGHHLQIALAQELGEMPNFRRHAGYTAFVEGWGLYSESLGEALGLYADPYSKFGQLTYEMWRALRLVIDTGIHAMGWSRQQAIDYFMANAAKSENDIVNEVDRYIAWPGQALAYKIGELRIQALRERAQERLGGLFDLRAFHDTVLGAGAIPLDVLEERVQQWIEQRLAAAPLS